MRLTVRPLYKTLLALAVLAVAAGVFGTTLLHAVWMPGQEPEVPAPVAVHASRADEPVRLRIPALGIDAAVQHVGLGKSGAMAVPTNYSDVAWYRYGPAPGALGSAVVDGHVDNGLSLPGVFKHLNDIKVGDRLEVVAASGAVKTFKVTDVKTYPYDAVPTELIFNRGDTARLNLITCEGAWVPGKKTYDERLVVFSELE